MRLLLNCTLYINAFKDDFSYSKTIRSINKGIVGKLDMMNIGLVIHFS